MSDAHRNGETEPPTRKGYYWYRGRVIKPGQKLGKRRRVFVYVWVDEGWSDRVSFDNKVVPLDSFKGGEWWGPIVPPWARP
jgi:hypothetical protein